MNKYITYITRGGKKVSGFFEIQRKPIKTIVLSESFHHLHVFNEMSPFYKEACKLKKEWKLAQAVRI